MRIHVMLFGAPREAAGAGSLDLEFEGRTVGDALAALASQYPALEPHLARARAAVNEEFRDPAAPLREGDTLAVIPPVSGGAW